MSAAQIIEEIKALPPEERKQVYDYVQDAMTSGASKTVSDAAFQEAKTWVFKEHAELLARLAK